MKKLVMPLLMALFMAGWSSARALVVNYTVDVGSGFGVPVTSTVGQSVLVTEPMSGVLDIGPAPNDLDVVTLYLGTNRTSGLDTINEVRNYRIRIFLGDTPPADVESPDVSYVDWVQSMDFTVRTRRFVAEGVLNAPITLAPVGPQMLDGVPITLMFKSFDFPGAPQFVGGLGVTGKNYEGVGAKTDLITSPVPEPGAFALLLGAAVPATLFGLRRRARK